MIEASSSDKGVLSHPLFSFFEDIVGKEVNLYYRIDDDRLENEYTGVVKKVYAAHVLIADDKKYWLLAFSDLFAVDYERVR